MKNIVRASAVMAAVASLLLTSGSAASAGVGPGGDAGGPGVNGRSPNIGNFGTCISRGIFTDVLPSTNPDLQRADPGVVIQPQPFDSGVIRFPNEGNSCSVAFSG